METAFKWLQACALLLSALVLAKWICHYSAGWLTYFFLFWKTLKHQRRGEMIIRPLSVSVDNCFKATKSISRNSCVQH
ncbi:hypothetical protein KP509_1Z232100 [Ceratopteris richardii]|nr:hypothetical protein KP509_1Z232100 [Ceratopteris richardii]